MSGISFAELVRAQLQDTGDCVWFKRIRVYTGGMKCERVWYIEQDDDITMRPGEVTLDIDEVVENYRDVQSVLTIGQGLKPRDFAVFMRPEVTDMPIDQVEGYLVGAVALDGSGVIVHNSLVEQSPRSFAVGHIEETWRYLEEIEPQIFSEFGLKALQSYLR
jgi:hypothetical protein